MKTKDLIDRKTLADQAFDYLSQAILSGELRNGDRLVESDLSQKLGISRAPIREALAELERQGLAYSLVRRGHFVRPWTKQDLWEVAILHATLEALAVQLAITNMTQDNLKSLEQIIEEIGEAERISDIPLLIDLDFDFHELMVERCQHGRLQQALSDMQLQIRIFRILTKRTDYETYQKTHGDLLVALRTEDPQIVQQAVYSHVMESADLALAAVPDGDVLSIPNTSSGA